MRIKTNTKRKIAAKERERVGDVGEERESGCDCGGGGGEEERKEKWKEMWQ